MVVVVQTVLLLPRASIVVVVAAAVAVCDAPSFFCSGAAINLALAVAFAVLGGFAILPRLYSPALLAKKAAMQQKQEEGKTS